MIAIPGIREWMENNKPIGNKNQLDQEFEWIQMFITNAIRDKEQFTTIYR